MLYSAATTDSRIAVENAIQTAEAADVVSILANPATNWPAPARLIQNKQELAAWLSALRSISPVAMDKKQLYYHPRAGELVIIFGQHYAAAQHLRKAKITFLLFKSAIGLLAQRPESNVTYQCNAVGTKMRELVGR